MTRIAGKRMRTVLSNFMAVWLLILAVTGWCCHQPCDCAQAAPNSVSPAHLVPCCAGLLQPSKCAEDCCNNTHDAVPPRAPCKDHSKCQGVCIYLPAETNPVDGKLSLMSFYLDSVNSAQVGLLGTPAFCFGGPCDLVGPAPPSRLHVLHQVFLI